MTNIRIDPSHLRDVALQLDTIADRVRSLGNEAHQITLDTPSYDGQFGPKARALGMEAEARLTEQARRLSSLSEELVVRAAAFEAVDRETLIAFDQLTEVLQSWMDRANLVLSPLVRFANFPWERINRYLRLGYLIEDPGNGGGDGEDEGWSPPGWAPFVIGLANTWTWYDQHINRFIYQTFGIQVAGFPADGPITPALQRLSQTDAAGNPISLVGADLVDQINNRGGVIAWFSDTLTGGGGAAVAPMQGLIWLPENYANPNTQEQISEARVIAHELAHVLQRDLAEFPDGTPTLFPPSPSAGSWPWGPDGVHLGLEYGAPLIGDFTLYMEVQSNIVEKAIHYDLLQVEITNYTPGSGQYNTIQGQMDGITNSLATYTGDAADACAYVVQEYNAHGMYVGEMAKEVIQGARIPPGGWEHWLSQQGFSDDAIAHIADIADQGTPNEVYLSGMLDSHPEASPTMQPAEVPTPSPTPTPTRPAATPSGTPDPSSPPTSTPTPTPSPDSE